MGRRNDEARFERYRSTWAFSVRGMDYWEICKLKVMLFSLNFQSRFDWLSAQLPANLKRLGMYCLLCYCILSLRLMQCVIGVELHYGDVIMGAMATQITSLTIVYFNLLFRHNSCKHQSSASLAFVRGISRWLANSPHKWPVKRKMFPLDDVIMAHSKFKCALQFTKQHRRVCVHQRVWHFIIEKQIQRCIYIAIDCINLTF